MNIFKKIKRLWYRWLNSDPYYKCPVFLEDICPHVDGVLCYFPDCDIYHKRMGNDFVGCAGCVFQQECCSSQFGLGCYDGKEA